MILIDKIINEEKNKLNFIERFFKLKPTFYFINDIEYNLAELDLKDGFTVNRSVFYKIISILFSFLGCFSILMFFLSSLILGFIVLIPLTFSILWTTLVFKSLFSKKYNNKLVFKKDTLKINKHQYNWSTITDYFLMERQSGKFLIYTLFLLIEKNEVVKISLIYTNVSEKKVMKLIENYKNDLIH